MKAEAKTAAPPDGQPPVLAGLGLLVLAVLLWSGHNPRDRFTWFLEVLPALLAAPLLALTYRRFRFTTLTYTFIALHMAVLMVGGKYTYAEVPLFNWIRDAFGLSRNYYDRIGHLFQGFVPALIAREVLVRKSPLRPGGWLFFLVTCVCLSISAVYEFFEWGVAVATGTAADAFLGTQGDVWDTQWDMAMALVGALLAQLLLSRIQDRQMARARQ